MSGLGLMLEGDKCISKNKEQSQKYCLEILCFDTRKVHLRNKLAKISLTK